MTELVPVSIGIGLAAVGSTALLVGCLAIRAVKKHGHAAAWQRGVTLVAVSFIAGAVSIGYGVAEWNSNHPGAPAGPTYSGPLQDPAPDDGCTAGSLTC